MIKIHLYTDGSCDKARFGGWAFVVTEGPTAKCTVVHMDCDGEVDTTVNRMELQAVINGLRACRVMYTTIGAPPPINPKVHIDVFSDSAYVVNCFKDRWYRSWLANDWVGSAGPVKNVDLWKELLYLANDMIGEGFNIEWNHVRGHRDTHWNNICDIDAGNSRKKKRNEMKGGAAGGTYTAAAGSANLDG